MEKDIWRTLTHRFIIDYLNSNAGSWNHRLKLKNSKYIVCVFINGFDYYNCSVVMMT
jgi:hypothetical protein